MKKNYILFILLLQLAIQVNACDMCGSYMGITPYDNQSGFGIFHRYRSFSGYDIKNQQHHFFPTNAYRSSTLQPSSVTSGTIANPTLKHGDTHGSTEPQYDPSDFEIYKTIELRAKYFLHKRWEVNAILPYSINTSQSNGNFSKIKGFGDITLTSGFHFIRKIEVEKMQHRLIGGLGIKLPTGLNNHCNVNGERHNYLLQTGTGTTDGFVYINYIVGIRNFGLNALSTFKINGTNGFSEKTANSLTAYLNLFYKLKYKNWYFIPSIQNNYEYTSGLYINNELTSNTNMNNLMSGIGLDLFYKNVGLNMAYQVCAFDQTAGTNLRSAGRMVIGLTLNLNQTKYLLKSKE